MPAICQVTTCQHWDSGKGYKNHPQNHSWFSVGKIMIQNVISGVSAFADS